MFYQRLFTKGLRSEYFEVTRGQDLASVHAEQARAEVTTLQAMQAFQAKIKEARKNEMEVTEEIGDLAVPNSWLRRLGVTTYLEDFSDKKQFLRSLMSLKHILKPDNPEDEDDSELWHIHAAVRRLIRKTAAAARLSAVSWNVLFKVNRKELHKNHSTPFHFSAQTGRWQKPTHFMVRSSLSDDVKFVHDRLEKSPEVIALASLCLVSYSLAKLRVHERESRVSNGLQYDK